MVMLVWAVQKKREGREGKGRGGERSPPRHVEKEVYWAQQVGKAAHGNPQRQRHSGSGRGGGALRTGLCKTREHIRALGAAALAAALSSWRRFFSAACCRIVSAATSFAAVLIFISRRRSSASHCATAAGLSRLGRSPRAARSLRSWRRRDSAACRASSSLWGAVTAEKDTCNEKDAASGSESSRPPQQTRRGKARSDKGMQGGEEDLPSGSRRCKQPGCAGSAKNKQKRRS